jgi:uncharacterized membrane protein (UPF0182 family)
MPETIDWPPSRPPRARGPLLLFAGIIVLLLAGTTALSYYVDALWFDALGYGQVFWKTLDLQALIFSGFTLVTFVVLYGTYVIMKPARLSEFATSRTILINGQPFTLPVEPVLRAIALGGAGLIALVTGAGFMAEWPTFAEYWYAPVAGTPDVIFHRPTTFYLFTLPAWELLSGWVMTLAVIACLVGVFFVVVAGGSQMLTRRRSTADLDATWRALSVAVAVLLIVFAFRVYLGRFALLFDDHTIFAGVTYTDAHINIPGLLLVSIALVVGALLALVNLVTEPKLRWLVASIIPAALCYVALGLTAWYVDSFIVKPNQLARERPFIANNIAATRAAFALDRVSRHDFPAEGGVAGIDASANQQTIQNIRLWDWRALQDTLRQIQEIRTYYDFPDIDIDRYVVDGQLRQMMLAVRELSVAKLPESSRNWINEKLIYTHGYGVTMNSVNGFTPEGLPKLILSNMPVESTEPTSIKVTRPEIYFGELTNTDVYVKTRQREFNYPQGESNSFTEYEGTGGIVLGGFFRKLVIALDRGDLAKLPFSDDVTPDSRLLMRRDVRTRVSTLAPFVTFDPDPYIVVARDGRLFWMMDGFTTSDSYPYARHYGLDRDRINYMRNSVKAVIDAYNGTTTFYVFDPADPIVNTYRAIFPTLFKDASNMPADLQQHVRYPELLLRMQAAVYGLYHMIDPETFYNREDLWTVASQVGLSNRGEQATEPMEPNFVLMSLPGGQKLEFDDILPFTPANRNNLIGWIAGRSDQPNYGTAVVYDFPKTRLIDGPLQVEARIDQNPELSAQLSLWNQQGSHVRRGNLLVIPIGRTLLYAEPIYLQAERSPMPELRLVVLATQDRLVYGPTFESTLGQLFGSAPPPPPVEAGETQEPAAPTPAAAAQRAQGAPGASTPPATAPGAPPLPPNMNALIAAAARDLADYQRLTAEGRMGEAGQKLQDLKQKLDRLSTIRR